MAIEKTATMASIIVSVLKKTATRTEMIIDGLTIIMWTPEIIVSSSQLTIWKPKSIISGAESSISRTELIIGEAKLIVSNAKAFISGPDLIISVTNMIISAPLFPFRCAFRRGSTTLHLSELGCPAGEGAGTLCAATVFPHDSHLSRKKPKPTPHKTSTPASRARQVAEPRGRVLAGERERSPDGPRSSDTAASLADSVGGTHSCHSIPIEHRSDPLLAWPARRNSHTASRSTDELRILTLAVSHI